MNDQPIGARPATASYHLVKFARRHRVLVGAAVAVVVALVLGLVGTLYGLSRAATERDDVERRFRQARTLLNFQGRMFQSADPLGEGVKVRDLLDRSVLLANGFGADPVEEAAIRLSLGKAYRGIGLFDQAEELVAAATETLERELGSRDLSTLAARTEWASLLGHPMGRYHDAERALKGVIESAARAHGESHDTTLSARLVQTELHYELGRYQDGLELARVVEQRADTGSSPWLSARKWQSKLLTQLGESEAAIEIAREYLDWHIENLGREHPNTWGAMDTLGVLLQTDGYPLEGAPIVQELFELRSRFLGAEHPLTIGAQTNVAIGHTLLENHERAEELLLEVLEICEAQYAPNHPARLTALSAIAHNYCGQGQFAQAELMYGELLDLTVELRGPEHRNTLSAMANLALVLGKLDRPEEAEQLYLEGLARLRDTLGDRHLDTLVQCLNLGGFYLHAGRLEESELLLREAVDTGRDALGPDHDAIPNFLRSLGVNLTYQHRFEEAEALLLESRELTERTHPHGHSMRSSALRVLENLYLDWGRDAEAAVYRKLLQAGDA